MPVDVKICGVTRPADAQRAHSAGARYVGVVFAGGPRVVGVQQAAAIVAAVPDLAVFGVFASQSVADILAVRDRAGLRGAQLHGQYPASAAKLLRADGMIVWRVVRIRDAPDLDRLPAAAEDADAVLVEPWIERAAGGSGRALADDLAIAARERLFGRRMVLAGGLTADRVGFRAALVRPDVVDVSSGVEIQAGIKDAGLITRFMEALI